MERLHRLIYTSQIAADPSINVDDLLREILAVSSAGNRERGITGLLIAHRGWFVQALEGPSATIHERFQVIVRDRRHRNALLIGDRAIEARAFGAWNMCAVALSSADDLILAQLDRKASLDPSTLPEHTALSLLQAVAEVHGRALDAQQAELTAYPNSAARSSSESNR